MCLEWGIKASRKCKNLCRKSEGNVSNDVKKYEKTAETKRTAQNKILYRAAVKRPAPFTENSEWMVLQKICFY